MDINPSLYNNLYIFHREGEGRQKFLRNFTVEDWRYKMNNCVVIIVFARLPTDVDTRKHILIHALCIKSRIICHLDPSKDWF